MRLIFTAKLVQYIRRFYSEAIIVTGLGELQVTPANSRELTPGKKITKKVSLTL